MNFAVLGAGSWGVAISNLLADNGHNVILWHYRNIDEDLINCNDISTPKIKDRLNSNISITSALGDINKIENFICAIPSSYIFDYIKNLDLSDKNFINCSKGFSPLDNGLLSKSILKETSLSPNKICILSGPNHAEEVELRVPTATVLASKNHSLAKSFQSAISNDYFRIYTSTDTIGVEVGGCVKNIIAIASGICIGLGMGDNTVAALLSRSLEEIKRLGEFFGGNQATFNGLSGIGDLVVTSFSRHSRNRKVGIQIAKGNTLSDIISSNLSAEGISATQIVHTISKENDIDMPISNEVYNILFNSKDPQSGISKLMKRELVSEVNI